MKIILNLSVWLLTGILFFVSPVGTCAITTGANHIKQTQAENDDNTAAEDDEEEEEEEEEEEGEDDPEDEEGEIMPFDTTMVYTIKYLSGWKAQQSLYMGVDFDGTNITLDSVYAHIPDGQYIVNRFNKHSLISRTLTARMTDTIRYCLDDDNKIIPNTFVYNSWDIHDTVEIKPVTNVLFDKRNPYLGYKYLTPEGLSEYCYYFSCYSPDSLAGRLLGADTTVILLSKGDTATFILEEYYRRTAIQAFGDIAALQRIVYRLRSASDQSLYLSMVSESFPYYAMTDNKDNAGIFYLKEGITRGVYYLICAPPVEHTSSDYILMIDPESKRLMRVHNNTTDKTLFYIGQLVRPQGEPDPYTYLKQFPNLNGRGHYEFLIVDPNSNKTKSLTKDFYDYAALGLEGESMLRAGSYTPSDLQLWMDTAIGFRSNPDKPSFYIVKDADTASAGANKFNMKGYYLHVMDSIAHSSNTDYNVMIDGRKFNRLNFVNATRYSTNELQLATGQIIRNNAINEYRFYFQETGDYSSYYLVTEAKLGDGQRTDARGYLSIKNDTLYVGPRENALKVQIRSGIVSNETVPLLPAESGQAVIPVGGKGKIDLLNAAGRQVSVYNILGRLVASLTPVTGFETIPVAKGVYIVKTPAFTRKVTVQ